MGGPISFLLGLGLLGAEAVTASAKKEEMRRYNEAKKADRTMPGNMQFRLETRVNFSIRERHNPCGIDARRLVDDLMKTGHYNYHEAENEATLLICNYVTSTMSDYEYSRSKAYRDYYTHCISCENSFDISEYVLDDWGKPAEFDKELDCITVMSLAKSYRELTKEPLETQIRAQAWYWGDERQGYMIGYEFFNYGNFPEWYENRVELEMRWRRELGIE